MPGEQSEREEIRPAVPASIQSPVRLNTANTVDVPGLVQEQATETASVRPPRRPVYTRHPFLALGTLAFVLLLMLLLISNIGRSGKPSGTVQTLRPTATTRPTATPSTVPTPTARTGYVLFVDNADGFLLQYPVGWAHRLNYPGAQFSDDASNTTFEMLVLLPSDSAASGLRGNPNDPTSWVKFAMQSFATDYAGDFQEDAGPLPAATFAGTTWQTGRGLITDQVSIRVQVYATVYQGKPYIIGLFAADATFNLADKVYFQPMRESFEFLPSAV